MQWLLANMWMTLAAAAALGLIFGFSMRGLLTVQRVRRATVERDVARTELEQSRAEVDALYAAQRKRQDIDAQPVPDDSALRAALADRDARLAALTEELTASRAEIEVLKTSADTGGQALQMAGAGLVGAVGTAAVAGSDSSAELTELRERNVWLEERVARLEADLSAQAAVASEPVVQPVAAGQEKLKWQNTYLRQRVDALETKIVAMPAGPVVETVTEPPTPTVAAVTEVANQVEETKGQDEELARLRWRNRYLEGRLAYYEEMADAEEALAETTVETTEPAPEAEPSRSPDTGPLAVAAAASLAAVAGTAAIASVPDDDDLDDEIDQDHEDVESAEDHSDDVHPSEAMLAELDETLAEGREAPPRIDQPDSGGDDLTEIGGIGPRINEILNDLGIWTWAQIADWTPENVAWIEDHLSFTGRVERERWIEQARDLID